MLGRDLVAIGLIIVFSSFVISILFFGSAQDVVAVLAPITTLIGTLIGTIFGVQTATQAGTEQQKVAAASGAQTAAAAALVDPKEAPALFKQWNDSGPGNPRREDL
jgi:hypothetical protein